MQCLYKATSVSFHTNLLTDPYIMASTLSTIDTCMVYMTRITLALVCVTAAGLLVIIQ